jgi:hypothetical protein
MRLLIVAALLLCTANDNLATPSTQAVRLGETPVVDGDVLNDKAWTQFSSTMEFTQQQPQEGLPASQETKVFIGFSNTHLYVAFVCYDDSPDEIIVTSQNRDASLSSSDSFTMVIDTSGNRQHGVVFGTNPTGLEYDGEVANESGSRFGNQGFDLNWDTTWQVEALIGDFGWSGEMAIPFTSLRYGGDEIQSWGFNFERAIRRNNELAYWSPLPRQYGLNRLSLAGSIDGIEVPAQQNFVVTPYALSKSVRPDGNSEQDFGFDLKYSITPSLTLDATYNTDFAQVEVDRQKVNLDRFSLFFPEKRPFFQENASEFQVGTNNTQLFFSRRIGIGPNGEAIPIDAGLRLSGKVGNGTNIGLLAMRAKAVADIAPQNDFAVVRVRQELTGRSSVGMLFVNRNGGGTDNQTYAVDGRWGLGERVTLSGFVARTQTADLAKDDHAARLFAGYNSKVWSLHAALMEVGEGFNPEVGFLSRRGFRNLELFALRSSRPKNKNSSVLEYRPHASYRAYWDFHGFLESARLHLDHSLEFKNGAGLAMGVNHVHEGVKTAFEISSGVNVPARDYDDWEFFSHYNSNSSAALSFNINFQGGGFFGGDRLGVGSSIDYRISESFKTSLSFDYNDIDLPEGSFDVGLTNFRVSYSFTPKISIAAQIQHNDRDQVLATNLRFSWIQDANAGLFVVYNETDDDINFPGRPRQEFIVKYSRIVSIL